MYARTESTVIAMDAKQWRPFSVGQDGMRTDVVPGGGAVMVACGLFSPESLSYYTKGYPEAFLVVAGL